MIHVKAGTIITHCIGWLLFLLLPILFINGQNDNVGVLSIIASPFYWLFLICYAILFYSHTYYIFPRWYQQKKYFLYAIFLLGFLVLLFFVSPFDKLVGMAGRGEMRPAPPPGGFQDFHHDMPRRGPHGRRNHFDIVSIILYFMTLALSVAVITIRQLRLSTERMMLAETKKAQAELSYLKAQINPHFLFNTLNNIYVLASGSHENTAPAVLKLSNILRYVTDEVSEDFVALEKEVNCIRDYIDLQKLRLSAKTTVAFSFEGDFRNAVIPPMVFMTFIENAFKFGISNHEESVITINIEADENRIDFFCRNKIFNTQLKERSGIGLTNTQQRLDYLYKQNYELHTGEANGFYTVKLRIHK